MRWFGIAAGRSRVWRAAWVAVAVLAVPVGPAWAQSQEMMFRQADLVRGLLPTVVNITARAEVAAPTADLQASAPAAESQQQYEMRVNAGSGFIIRSDGVIATNWHVVDGAYEIFATFSDGSRAKAEVLNAARLIDIAILKVDVGHPLPAVKWGDSTKVQIGDPVLAIGNPLGIGLSVTAGIVSALNRNLMDTPYDDFIQTDAPINHGNSGGPLFDMQGGVIGINTALISPTTGSAGLGFAIPSQDAHAVIDRLLAYGWVRPAWLGVKIQLVTPDMANALGLKDPQGSIVAWVVAGGPAEKAGLKCGDVILKFGNEVPTDDRALLRTIAASPPGEKVMLSVWRDGKLIEVPVQLAEWPKMQWEQRDAPTKAVRPHWNIGRDLGITVKPLPPGYLEAKNFPAGAMQRPAVLVTGIARDAEATRHGLGVGDVILQIGNTPIGSAAQFQAEIDRARQQQRTFAMFLVLPKNKQNGESKFPGPKWIPLRVQEG
jgi:serine protease Do